MGMVVEEGGPCFHNGLTTCTHSSSRDLTLTPMRMPMPMPTTIWTSTTTSTRYRLPGTLIASPPPTIISRITTVIITTIIRVTITIIAIIIIIITITTITIIRFKSISISPEISVIETPVLVCKVTRLPERFCSTECSSLFRWSPARFVFFSSFFFLCFSLFTCRPINYRRISSLFSLFYDTYPSICFISIVLSISALCSVGIVSTHLCLHVCRFTSRFEPEEFDFHTRTHTRARAYISIVLTFFFCSTLFDWRCLGFEFCLTSSNFQFSPLFTFVHFLLVSRNGRQSLNWELARQFRLQKLRLWVIR